MAVSAEERKRLFEEYQAATVQARAVVGNKDATQEQRDAAMAEFRSARDGFALLQAQEQQEALAADGSEIRRDLNAREAFDHKRGKMVFDATGRATVAPSVKEFLATGSLAFPIPEEIAGDAVARACFLPVSADPRADDDVACRYLQGVNDAAILVAAFTGKKSTDQLVRMKPIMAAALDYAAKSGVMHDDGSTGTSGGSWIPEYFSASLVQDFYLEARLLGLFNRFPMSGPTVNVPTMGNRPRAFRAAAMTDGADFARLGSRPSTASTGRKTFNAEKVQILIGVADEFEEDAAINTQQILRQTCVDAMASDVEDALVNGCTNLSGLDNASGTAANQLWAAQYGEEDIRASWDGLRSYAHSISNTVDAGGTGQFDSADIRALRRALGKYASGAARDNCVFIAGPDAEVMLLGLTEVATMEKFGPQAAIVTGEIGRIYGIPIVPSGLVYGPSANIGLNSSGVWDNTTKTGTIMLAVNRNAWWWGDRRMMRVEGERSVVAGGSFIAVSLRADFQHVYSSTAKTTAVLRNMVP